MWIGKCCWPNLPAPVEAANEVVPIGLVLADAEFDSERNHTFIRQQLGARHSALRAAELVPANPPSPAARLGFPPLSLEASLGSTQDVNRAKQLLLMDPWFFDQLEDDFCGKVLELEK